MPRHFPRFAILDLSDRSADHYLAAAFESWLRSWGVPSATWLVGSEDRGARERDTRGSFFNAFSPSQELLRTFQMSSRNIDVSIFLFESLPLSASMFVDGEQQVTLARLSQILTALEPLDLPIVVIGDASTGTAAAIQWLTQRGSMVGLVQLDALGGSAPGDNIAPHTTMLGRLRPPLLAQSPKGFDWPGLIRFAGEACALSDPVAEQPVSGAISHRQDASAKRGSKGVSTGATVLMVQGTSSNVGKTFVATALARYFSNQGYAVAPFKAQNMSNNARIVDGGEIGTAQYFQALAARAKPDARMNPVLIKPQASAMRILINGKVDRGAEPLPWRLRKPLFWPHIREALHSLRRDYELIIIEGAGSPVELYLPDNDVVNMRVAEEVNANVVIVVDGARGGAFTHLFGTWALLPEAHKRLVRGFILNLFFQNGRPELFEPGCERLAALTGGTPTLGILPKIEHSLPDEDRFSMEQDTPRQRGDCNVVILKYPHGSNLDEFQALSGTPGVSLTWAASAAQIRDADLVILPGSRDVISDLEWMRRLQLDKVVIETARRGVRILGICGGLQILGRSIEDPHGIEGSGEGLGLLDIGTVFHGEKIQRQINVTFARVPAPWSELSAQSMAGYEIRHGRSSLTDASSRTCELIEDGRAFLSGSVLGVYMHGLFENQGFSRALFATGEDFSASLNRSFERMAQLVEQHLDMEALGRIALETHQAC